MNKAEERALYLEMLSELISTRRSLTDEILLVRTRLGMLDDEVKQESEYMSAEAYITLRNNIKKELDKDMREQIKREVMSEYVAEQQTAIPESTPYFDIDNFLSEPSSSIIEPEVIAEAKYQEKQRTVKKDLSVPVLCNVAIRILKEYGMPMSLDAFKIELEADRNNVWKQKTWTQLVWKMKQHEPKLQGAGRGYLQYVGF